MDKIDKKILQLLQDDAKTQHYKIAEQLKIGTSTVHFRIKKMIKKGIIKSFSAIIDPEKLGYNTKAWIGISADPRRLNDIATKLALYDEIQIVTTAAGDHEILLQIMTKNEKELWHFINDKIKTIEGIEREIHVSTFLDIYKEKYHRIVNKST